MAVGRSEKFRDVNLKQDHAELYLLNYFSTSLVTSEEKPVSGGPDFLLGVSEELLQTTDWFLHKDRWRWEQVKAWPLTSKYLTDRNGLVFAGDVSWRKLVPGWLGARFYCGWAEDEDTDLLNFTESQSVWGTDVRKRLTRTQRMPTPSVVWTCSETG